MIAFSIDTQAFQDALGQHPREMIKGIITALNRLGESGYAAIRENYPRHFQVRNRQLLDWLAPRYLGREAQATPTNLSVLLTTAGRASLLSPFETGLPHTTDRLGRLVAIPSDTGIGLRAFPMQVIPRALYPVNLGLQIRRDPKQGVLYYALGRNAIKRKLTPERTTASGKIQLQGKQGTFQVDGPRGPIIFQRYGPGRRDVRALWFLRPSVRRPADLEFFKSVQVTVDEQAVPTIEAAINDRFRAIAYKASH